jgi:hypothetical protein
MIRILLTLAIAVLPVSAWADVTCTLTGAVTIDSSDTFYCDTTGGQDCTGWRETNLDTVSKPMRFLQVEVRNTAATVVYGRTFTNSSGNYTITVSLPGSGSCNGKQVSLVVFMKRVHEDDLAVQTPRFRFKVTHNEQGLETSSHGFTHIRTLTAATSTANWHFARANPETEYSTVANIYYTLNSALTEAVTWSDTLDQAFQSTNESAGGIFRVKVSVPFDPNDQTCGTATACFQLGAWMIYIQKEIAGNGLLLRHEVGHALHHAIHGKVALDPCVSPEYNGDNGRNHQGCEWGSYVTSEMFVNVLATRSIVEEVRTNAWRCGSTTANRTMLSVPQQFCSDCRTTALSDADRIIQCAENPSGFVGIGDAFASSNAHCTRIRVSEGCDCVDSNSNDLCDDYQSSSSLGWRNPVNFERFMWDMIDTNNEGGQDDTAYYIQGLVNRMTQYMGFGNPPEYGEDGTCWEHNPGPGNICIPHDPKDPHPGGPAEGTRDGYHTFDFASAITGDQGAEMALNCSQGAYD